MKKYICTLVVLIASLTSNTQIYVKPRAISTDLNSCNNTAVCELYGITSPSRAEFTIGAAPSLYPAIPVSDGDTIYNFCLFDVSAYNHHEISIYYSNGYNSTFLTYSTLITPDFNYSIQSYVEPTNESSTDGSFIIEFDSAITAYNFDIFQDGGYIPTITILDAYSMSISGLNAGYITFGVQDPSDIYNRATFSLYVGDASGLYINTGLDMGLSLQHANSSCTGWINFQPLNALGTVYNSWSDSTYNQFTRTDLCAGIYSVYTYDQVAGINVAGSIDTVVIADNNTVYIDTNLFSITPQDTSYYFDVACTFDYGQPIDSVHYFEDTISFSGGLLIATFDMILYQGNNMLTISDSLITLSDSTVLLDVVIYCTLFKSEDFLARRIMFLRGVDNHYFTQPYLNTEQVENQKTSKVYPIPTSDKLNIDFGQSGKYTVTIVDLQGKQCYSADAINTAQIQIETEFLMSGSYILIIQSENTVEQHQFIKLNN